MKYLYTMNSKITFKEYKKFNYTISRRIGHTFFLLALSEITFLLINIAQKAERIYTIKSMIIYTITLPLFFHWIIYREMKKMYNSNKMIQNLEVTYEFYDTYFVEKSECGETKTEYSKFYKIIETKTNFYLMIAKNQGYILPKSDMPNGLEEFIKNTLIN